MYADHNLPYLEWSALTRDRACMLYPGLHPWTSYRARFRLGRTPLGPATARALAHTMYAAGADGLSLYNHFGAAAWQAPFYPQSMQLFHQLRDPERVARGERHYIFDPTYAGLMCLAATAAVLLVWSRPSNCAWTALGRGLRASSACSYSKT